MQNEYKQMSKAMNTESDFFLDLHMMQNIERIEKKSLIYKFS